MGCGDRLRDAECIRAGHVWHGVSRQGLAQHYGGVCERCEFRDQYVAGAGSDNELAPDFGRFAPGTFGLRHRSAHRLMLEVRALTRRYPGVLAVDRVSFTALPGESPDMRTQWFRQVHYSENDHGTARTHRGRDSVLRPAYLKPTWTGTNELSATCRGAIPLSAFDRRGVLGIGPRTARPADSYSAR